MGLRMPEILLIMGVLLLIFGGTRLPQLGSALGSAIRNFKRSFGGDSEPAAPAAPTAGATDERKQPGTLASSTTVDKEVGSRTSSHQG